VFFVPKKVHFYDFYVFLSGGGLVMEGFTCSVQPEDKDELADEEIDLCNGGIGTSMGNFNPEGLLMPAPNMNCTGNPFYGDHNLFSSLEFMLNAK